MARRTAKDETPAATPAPAAEPPSATHAAEDETWATKGDDAPHLEARLGEMEQALADARTEATRLQGELAEAKDRFLRARADYDNLAKRTAAERAEALRSASIRVIEQLLEPLEVLDRAATEAEAADDARGKGIRMAHQGLLAVLRREGLEEVLALGTVFDVKMHEAVAYEDSKEPAGTVISVVRPGYRLHGRVLRPAIVKVSAGQE